MSSNGIKTSFWGPHAWNFLFSTIAGSYPIKYDNKDKNHQKILKSFINMFNSLKETLPCIYCRESYKIFLKELPIVNYTSSRNDMMFWLYSLHDKVNKKLIEQEKECFNNEQKKLKENLINKTITLDEFKKQSKLLKSSIMITKSSPPFSNVLNKFEKQRAGCSNKSKKCI